MAGWAQPPAITRAVPSVGASAVQPGKGVESLNSTITRTIATESCAHESVPIPGRNETSLSEYHATIAPRPSSQARGGSR